MAGELFRAARGISRAQPQARFRRRAGVVVSVETGYTCTVYIGGDNTSISGVRYFAHTAPRPGQQVWLDTDGYDVVIVGVVAGNGGSIPACRVYRSSAQTSVASGVSTEVVWTDAAFDPWGMWSTGSATDAQIVLPMDGVYFATSTIAFPASTSGAYRTIDILHAGSLRARSRYTVATGTFAGGTPLFLSTSAVISGTKSQVITVEGAADISGGTTFAQTGQLPFLAVTYLGPAA